MNLSRRTSSTPEKVISRIEMIFCENISADLASSSAFAPENSAPCCPMKLHAFLVMASYETIWHKVMIASEEIKVNKDYN